MEFPFGKFAVHLEKNMIFTHNEKEYKITRYPATDDKSLKPWNSADEYILNYIAENNLTNKKSIIYNDRFGFLSLLLNDNNPNVVVESKSQEKSIDSNFKLNATELSNVDILNPLDELQALISLGIIKVPKSMELFQLYLNQLSGALSEDAIVVCGFMTKYFTPQILEIAKEYFDSVEQSLAWKKSRLLILSKPKQSKEISIINKIAIGDDESIQQYFGVFSKNNIDYATRLLIANLNLRGEDKTILDLASGNGILAYTIAKRISYSELHLLDDSFLAVESSKLNVEGENTYFHYSDNLEELKNNHFDLIISNPPSHFGHETNIDISLSLFKEAKRVLKEDGHFQLVASKHLNYKTHLIKIFNSVSVTAENSKFIVYDCFG